MKRILISIVLSAVIFSFSYTMDKEVFDGVVEHLYEEEWDKAAKLLKEMKPQYVNDPEYYVLTFNYHFLLSQSYDIQIIHDEPIDESIAVIDSAGQVVSYLTNAPKYVLSEVLLGIEELTKGLSKFEDRLDMHYGLVYGTKESELYPQMTNALINILILSKKYSGKWKWSFNELYSNQTHEFILEYVQANIFEISNQEISGIDSLIIKISKTMISVYPNSAYGYCNIGARLINQDKYLEAEEYYARTEINNRDDVIVLWNLALIFEKTDRIMKAIEYYSRVIEVGNDNYKEWAEQRINEIQ